LCKRILPLAAANLKEIAPGPGPEGPCDHPGCTAAHGRGPGRDSGDRRRPGRAGRAARVAEGRHGCTFFEGIAGHEGLRIARRADRVVPALREGYCGIHVPGTSVLDHRPQPWGASDREGRTE
jgi:hypothetical protein